MFNLEKTGLFNRSLQHKSLFKRGEPARLGGPLYRTGLAYALFPHKIFSVLIYMRKRTSQLAERVDLD